MPTRVKVDDQARHCYICTGKIQTYRGGQLNKNPLLLFDGIPNDPATLITAYQDVRKTTELLCAPLEIEDYVIQAMQSASPTRWHLGHVSWFFETFILKPHLSGYQLDIGHSF